jgi:uncharacterized protein (TIGR03000 family)
MVRFFCMFFGLSALLGLMLLAEPGLAQAPAAKTVKSKVQVTVPQDDAELLIENKPTKTTGKVREFDTPELEAGKMFEYSFMVKWRPNNYTVLTRPKTIRFTAGDAVVVDLTKDEGKDEAVIRFVPTPEDIVDEMIKLAKITKDDVVFEPGCGDARVLIAAIKAGAKKAVGIDLDPERVMEAKAAVKEAKLDTQFDIRQGDALKVKDYGDATVMFLYMGEEFNLLLRPIILKDFKVGTRIVSHRFLMGDWKPDTTKKILGNDGEEYELHLWTVTEDVKKKYGPK